MTKSNCIVKKQAKFYNFCVFYIYFMLPNIMKNFVITKLLNDLKHMPCNAY